MNDDRDLPAATAIVSPLLAALETIAAIARHFHPSQLDAVGPALGSCDDDLRTALATFRAVGHPAELASFCGQIETATDFTLSVAMGLRRAAASDRGAWDVFRALRQYPRAVEALYPIAASLPAISKFFLEPAGRHDDALITRLADADAERPDTGVIHFSNDFASRGGFSLYVPETYDRSVPYRIVVALHGGSGHGRAFLWSWLREARTRGLIILAPTAIGDTWSLMAEDVDRANIERMLAFVKQGWNIAANRLLLTGMSDGGTFTLLAGLHTASPFTHLAPFAASFHPMLIDMSEPPRLTGLPIYLVHGAQDWMFPVTIARDAARSLSSAGARVTYREIADLAHTYPRDENTALLDWFL